MSENDLVHENVVKHLIIKKNSQDLKRDPSSKKNHSEIKNRCTFLYSPFEIRLKHIPSLFFSYCSTTP